MSIVKVIELIAQSDKSWEDAAQNAVGTASRTIQGIQGIYIENFQAVVEDGLITQYRVNAKISFLVNDDPA